MSKFLVPAGLLAIMAAGLVAEMGYDKIAFSFSFCGAVIIMIAVLKSLK